jgi:hypothetical protein
VAEALNNFFASVFTREDLSNIPHKAQETNARLNMVNISEEKIKKTIMGLRAERKLVMRSHGHYVLSLGRAWRRTRYQVTGRTR